MVGNHTKYYEYMWLG